MSNLLNTNSVKSTKSKIPEDFNKWNELMYLNSQKGPNRDSRYIYYMGENFDSELKKLSILESRNAIEKIINLGIPLTKDFKSNIIVNDRITVSYLTKANGLKEASKYEGNTSFSKKFKEILKRENEKSKEPEQESIITIDYLSEIEKIILDKNYNDEKKQYVLDNTRNKTPEEQKKIYDEIVQYGRPIDYGFFKGLGLEETNVPVGFEEEDDLYSVTGTIGSIEEKLNEEFTKKGYPQKYRKDIIGMIENKPKEYKEFIYNLVEGYEDPLTEDFIVSIPEYKKLKIPLQRKTAMLLNDEFQRRDFNNKKIKNILAKILNDDNKAIEFLEESYKYEIIKKTKNEPVEADLTALFEGNLADAQVYAMGNEQPEDDGFHGRIDDLEEVFESRGYTEEEQKQALSVLSGSSEEALDSAINLGFKKRKPVNLAASAAAPAPAAPVLAPVAGVVAVIPPLDPPIDPVNNKIIKPIDNINATGQGSLLPYKKRYHPNSLLLYFNNYSYPDFDKNLESSVQKMEVSKEEIIEMMEEIIKNYGSKIFVKARKSDTREELNELMQLQFCVMRNLQIGTRAKTANVRLSDLVKIDQLTNGGGGSAGPQPDGVVVNPINPVSVTSSSDPNVMSKSEDKFIKDYDNYLMNKNLSMNNTKNRTVPKQVITGTDPRNIAIIPGNNKISVERNRVRRI